MDLTDLTVAESARSIRTREVSPVELASALLHRIDRMDGTVMAWETIDREDVLKCARRAEQQARNGGTGALLGVPLGVKDIFYTKGLRTTSGSPLFRDFVPDHDATAVARLKAAGAVVVGKTVTVQFAYRDPPVTRNPWNPERTPGGSSSGSAAAVSARMVPAALGTQTGGSIIRPAAYCGVVGLKPSYGRVSRYGVTPCSWSLDHVGVLTRTVEDAALVLQVMAGHDPLDRASARRPVPDYIGGSADWNFRPRIALVSSCLRDAGFEVAEAVRIAALQFEKAGARLEEAGLPASIAELLAVRSIVHVVEAAALHERNRREHPEGYARHIGAQVEVGQLIPGTAYIQAQRLRRMWRPAVDRMFDGVDCVLMPSTMDVAPGRESIGKASFEAIWSLFGFPSIALPVGLSSDGLPLSIQLVARPYEEATLLRVAAWCESVLAPMPAPLAA